MTVLQGISDFLVNLFLETAECLKLLLKLGLFFLMVFELFAVTSSKFLIGGIALLIGLKLRRYLLLFFCHLYVSNKKYYYL